MNFSIKQLTNDDLLRFKDIRLKSLMESPFAFSDSYYDEILKKFPNNLSQHIIQVSYKSYGAVMKGYVMF